MTERKAFNIVLPVSCRDHPALSRRMDTLSIARNDLLNHGMHPRRRVLALLCKQFPILVIQRTGQFADHLAVDAVLADITQRLENCSCYLARADKRLRRRMTESDLQPTNFRSTGRTIGHIDHFSRHLGGKTQFVGRHSGRPLQDIVSLFCNRLGEIIGRRQ